MDQRSRRFLAQLIGNTREEITGKREVRAMLEEEKKRSFRSFRRELKVVPTDSNEK